MNIIVLDTETISLNKLYCYNLGYVIVDVSSGFKILKKRDFLIKEIYDNKPLMDTAYYENKRAIYEDYLLDSKQPLEKVSFIEAYSILNHDCLKYNIKGIFAYNSSFDEKVLKFNCNYFKIPYTLGRFYDIMELTKQTIAIDYKYKLYTLYYGNINSGINHDKLIRKNGKPKYTAESIYCYITKNYDFMEAHTALNDSEIELEILAYIYKIYGIVLFM